MATVSGSVVAQVLLDQAQGQDFGSGSYKAGRTKNWVFSAGTAADQVNGLFTDQRTVSASSDDDLDLAGGLTDPFGTTLTFTTIKIIYIEAAAANTNDLHIGGEPINPFINWVAAGNDIVVIKPGGAILLVAPGADGYDVTAGTGDIFRITNSAGGSSVTYDIIIAGEVA